MCKFWISTIKGWQTCNVNKNCFLEGLKINNDPIQRCLKLFKNMKRDIFSCKVEPTLNHVKSCKPSSQLWCGTCPVLSQAISLWLPGTDSTAVSLVVRTRYVKSIVLSSRLVIFLITHQSIIELICGYQHRTLDNITLVCVVIVTTGWKLDLSHPLS